MKLLLDSSKRLIVEEGGAFHDIVCAVQVDGTSPAKESLEELLAKHKGVLAALDARFEKTADYEHYQWLPWIKHEKGDIWTFKLMREKYRFPFFRDGKSLVLIFGFFKPGHGQKWPPQAFDRAERIMEEDRRRVAALRAGRRK